MEFKLHEHALPNREPDADGPDVVVVAKTEEWGALVALLLGIPWVDESLTPQFVENVNGLISKITNANVDAFSDEEASE